MKRILICFSYNGSAYSGYQTQKNAKSVQQTIEDALSKKLSQTIKLTATGRTDAGVHALCQYAHFDADIKFDAEKIVKIAKVVLPQDIVVYSAKQVPNDFNARFDVKKKTYMYVFSKNKKLLPFEHNLATFLDIEVDVQKMQNASQMLLGQHDFRAFCSSGTTVVDFVRTIYDIKIENTQDYLKFFVSGNGFLYNMVRIIVGTLIDIGSGKLDPSCLEKMLSTGKRELGGKTAKPNGLYLYDVEY